MADPPIRGKGLAYARKTHRARGANACPGGRSSCQAGRAGRGQPRSRLPGRPPRPAGRRGRRHVQRDISPPTNETKVDDHATSEIILAAHPDLVLTLGDNQYETGSGAMFHSAVGFDGSCGRIKGLIRPAEGNHDAADPGPGSPGSQEYFADNLANLECTRLNPPCRPDLGYYDFDLPNGWYVLVLNSNCGRAGGNTGDVQTPACGRGSAQLAWLGFAQQRRHGASTAARSAPSPSGTTSAGGPGSSPMTRQPTSSG
jgi:hypothetical protein